MDEILEKAYYKDKIVVVRRIEKIKINLNGALANINMSDSSHSEADTRIVLHVFPCVHSGLKDIYVRANDMDIVVIVVAYMPDFLEIYSNVRVSVVSGVGFNTSCISVNAIAAYIGLKKCKELLFLHSPLGSDCTSSFFHVGKVKFWDVWPKNSFVSETFLVRSNRPKLPLAEKNLKVIESFVCSVYVTEQDISPSADIARYQIFKYRGNSEMRSLPPTRDALIQHIHKAAYLSGYIWGRSHKPARTEESPTNWTWSFTDDRIKCQWVSYDHCLITQNLNKTVFKKCGC